MEYGSINRGAHLVGPYRYLAHLIQLDRCRPIVARSVPPSLISVNSPLTSHLISWQGKLRAHPDTSFSEYILRGLLEGFRIGFSYRSELVSAKGNMPSALEHPGVVEAYLGEECEAGRILGPFYPGEIPDLQVNCFGVIPKGRTRGKWRLITDLSFPENRSVNDGISSAHCSLEYTSVEKVARAAHNLGPGALLAKVDIKAAYRLVPVHPEEPPTPHLLGMVWKGAYYVDAMLPFGLHSAPKVFTAVADVLEWCIRQAGVQGIDHYLDDFIIVAPPASYACQSNLNKLEEECEALGFTLAPEKQEGPTTHLVFLGIDIDTVAGRLSLPADKLLRLRTEVDSWLGRKVCRRRDLESLVGVLQHAAKMVPPGRTFVRQMIDLLKGPRRPHYFIRLNQQFRADLYWWKTFAEKWNGGCLVPASPRTYKGVCL